MEIILPLTDAPPFVAGLHLTNDVDSLRVTLIKSNGGEYGFLHLTRADLLRLLDVLGIQ